MFDQSSDYACPECRDGSYLRRGQECACGQKAGDMPWSVILVLILIVIAAIAIIRYVITVEDDCVALHGHKACEEFLQ